MVIRSISLSNILRHTNPRLLNPARRRPIQPFRPQARPFTHTSAHRSTQNNDEAPSEDNDTLSEETSEDDLDLRALMRESQLPASAASELLAMIRRADSGLNSHPADDPASRQFMEELDPIPPQEVEPEPPLQPGFFAEGEENDDPGDDPDFEPDDITSMAHGELEQVRELREFARVIGWDMPLLWHHRKEFKPPNLAQQPLRFRYTTYMGENHGGSRKVVMDFSPQNLPDLSTPQQNKLIKLLGSRYDPNSTTAKMSSDRFPTSAQNKRYLIDTLERLMAEARDGQDMFEDVPFDFRHAKPKKKFEFPEEWKLGSVEKIRELEARRAARDKLESEKMIAGDIVEGKRAIKGGRVADEEQEPVMIGAVRKKRHGK